MSNKVCGRMLGAYLVFALALIVLECLGFLSRGTTGFGLLAITMGLVMPVVVSEGIKAVKGGTP